VGAWAMITASAVSQRPGTGNPVAWGGCPCDAAGRAVCGALWTATASRSWLPAEVVRAAQPQPQEGAASWSGLSAMTMCSTSQSRLKGVQLSWREHAYAPLTDGLAMVQAKAERFSDTATCSTPSPIGTSTLCGSCWFGIG
jgi:hypothetical protein